MGDFFAFRRMLAPLLIHIIFWVGVLGSLALGGAILAGQIDPIKVAESSLSSALVSELRAHADNLKLYLGLYFLIISPLKIRLVCELLMLPFRINGTLTDVRNTLLAQREVTSGPAPRSRL